VIGLFKTEEIHRRGPWKGLEGVEFATLEWGAWYNGSPPARTARLRSAGRVREGLPWPSGRSSRPGGSHV